MGGVGTVITVGATGSSELGISLKFQSQLSGLDKNDGTRFFRLIVFELLHADDDVLMDGVVCRYWEQGGGRTGVNNGMDCVNESA